MALLLFLLTLAGINLWELAASFLRLNAIKLRVGLPGWPEELVHLAKTVFHEIRPFYWCLVAVNSAVLVPKVGVTAIGIGHIALAAVIWFVCKDADNDDDRWKRRKKKATEAVEIRLGRLVVVPATR